MAEHPILFSGPMVRAILEGRKSQTRRVLKPQIYQTSTGAWHVQGIGGGAFCKSEDDAREVQLDYLKIIEGDTLWVREAHSLHRTHGQHRDDGKRWGPWDGLPTQVSPDGTQIAYYREGFDRCKDGPWRPSIHMPRWASRITLKVTGVKVERLQDISEADVIAEGLTMTAKAAFEALWTSINGQASWNANPWVVAYSFERVTP